MKLLKTFCYCKHICKHPNCGNRGRGEVVTVGGVAAVQKCIDKQKAAIIAGSDLSEVRR